MVHCVAITECNEPGVARAEGIAQIKIHNKKLYHKKRPQIKIHNKKSFHNKRAQIKIHNKKLYHKKRPQIKIHNKKSFHNKRLNKIKPSNQKGIALNQSYNVLQKKQIDINLKYFKIALMLLMMIGLTFNYGMRPVPLFNKN